MNSTGSTTVKEKTKAKKRYLKAKKERKKHRKAAAAKSTAACDPSGHDTAGEDRPGNDEWEDRDALDSDEERGIAEQHEEKTATRQSHKNRRHREKEKATNVSLLSHEDEGIVRARPRKRQKFGNRDPSPSSPSHAAAADSSDSNSSPVPSPPVSSSSAGRPPPEFSDHAPERSELASQGLDRALARAQLVDPLLSTPLSFDEGDDTHTGLSVRMRRRLRDLGITELFAVQTTLLPLLLPTEPLKRSLYLPYDPPSDICVSAPTGSGKTLAYVLPIVEILSARAVTRLRALVVLPTRDLVIQVRETFEATAKGRGLKIASVTGQHSFSHEQAQLVGKTPCLQGGSSKIDILVCTPGRLMDHLNGTPNFSLQHLRFLVIDEADRLLAQSFQDWLAQVLAATRPPAYVGADAALGDETATPVPHPDALSPAFLHLLRGGPGVRTDLDEKRESSCQKLLFSATLMNDPGRIAALELRTPRYVVVQSSSGNQESGVLGVAMGKFSMPNTLKEHMIVCDSSHKPLMLFHLVHSVGVTGALVFTKSAESTVRLVRLFEFFEAARTTSLENTAQHKKPVVVRAYSSDLSPSERKSILEKFRAQGIDMLVCSDLISRGIDIKHVAHVVNYDAPVDMRKYVHRVGRTARAGRAGDAWTLVEEQEARYFKNMVKAAGHAASISRLRVTEQQIAPFTSFYQVALAQLKDIYSRVN
ncbi:P-loop containing nucleoside triphosphate hydrolase protein [Lactifluus subvellereus]|nr:P-loop containing nucleoside triphosphate hydrolase protein [Lactifluus subvellereus]